MSRFELPDWITVQRGRAPVLLIAPHGGRRYDPRHPGKHKVNDLHTPDLTRELAVRLDATAIINAQVDRNQLDLNRVSQVRAAAPWLLPFLAEVLGAMVAEAGRATVLVIHGWNVTQAVCDVGIGLREGPDGLVPVRQDTATVSADFLRDHVRPLQQAAATAAIGVTIGSRYPAAHPNNLLQVFRADADRDAALPCPVAALCRTAPIEAVQLEFGIPLRWPGSRRDGFLAVLADAFAPLASRPDPRAGTPAPLALGVGRVTDRAGVQFVTDDLVVMASIDASEQGPVAGRLLVSRGADRLALFTGELHERAAPWAIPPLACRELPDGGLQVTYEGPLLEFASLTPFLDLERGLAGGALVEGSVDLTFRPDAAPVANAVHDSFGTVAGHIRIDGASFRIAVAAIAARGVPHLPRSLPALRVVLPASGWGPLVLREDPASALAMGNASTVIGQLVEVGSAAPIRAACEIVIARPGARLTLELSGRGRAERMEAGLERLIPVRRPGRADSVIETTYATIQMDGRCVGWTELTLVETADQPPVAAQALAITEA